jgi:hypothetical protein
MQSMNQLRTIPDDELLRRLASLVHGSRQTEAELVAHVGEVDARRLYARAAVPSMFQYCTERLHLSGAEAYLRIAAARASREHPVILAMLADGRLHLTAIAMIAPHLTTANREDLLARATHKSKRELEELLAEIAPRPDAPALVRKLPGRRVSAATTPVAPLVQSAETARQMLVQPAKPAPRTPLQSAEPAPETFVPSAETVPQTMMHSAVAVNLAEPPERTGTAASTPAALGAPSPGPIDSAQPRHERQQEPGDAASAAPELRLDGVASDRLSRTAARRFSIEPLSPGRYRVQFTASAELLEKLERLQDRMRSSVPDGDLAAIVDAAVTGKLESLERHRFGRPRPEPSACPQHSPAVAPPGCADAKTVAQAPLPQAPTARTDALPRTRPPSRHVPVDVQRAVRERDGDRCCYVDDQGRRCTARSRLEFHHRHPFALGGGHSVANGSLLCRTHNRLMADIDFGRSAMDRFGRSSKAASS